MARPGPWTLVALVALSASATTATASRLRPPPPPMMLVLEGRIDVGGDHAGILELRMDGEPMDAIPAGPGPFTLLLPAGAGAGMLSLEYSAPGVRLRSFLGGHGRLTRLAGADARLGPEDEAGLRLSPLSTAIAVVASSVDGTPPASDAALAAAIQAAWPSDIVVAATALERYAQDPGRLPDGFADGLALVEDIAAFSAELRDDPTLAASPDAVLDPLPHDAAGPRDLQPVLALAGPRSAPGVPEDGPGLLLERQRHGGFRLHGPHFDEQAYEGGFDAAGVLRLVPDASIGLFGGYVPCDSLDGALVMRTISIDARDLRRHWRSGALSLWQLGSDVSYRLHGCPGAEPEAGRWIELWVSPAIPRGRMHDLPARLVGHHALPMFCGVLYPHDIAVEACGRAPHLLARDGTGTAWPEGGAPLALAWGRDATGAIRLDYADGRASRLWLVDAGDGTTQTVAWVAEAEVVGYPGTGSGHATRLLDAPVDEGNERARSGLPGPRYRAAARR